jgi:tRNA modification GTPase
MDLARNNHTIMPPITEKVVRISALLETGIEELKKRIVEGLTSTHKIGEDESVIITNARHRSALLKSKNNLELALMSVKNKMSSEFIAFDMRTGLNNLGEIIGTVTTDEILDSIFTKFCIGK